MTTSPAGRALIKSFEGFRAAAYLPTPDDVPTIGYGHTSGVKMTDTCTEAQADGFLAGDLKTTEATLNNKVIVTVDLNQNEFDALSSFVYNVGSGNFESSTLLRRLNEENRDEAADQFLVWNKQADKVLQGLVNRRTAERELFLTEV